MKKIFIGLFFISLCFAATWQDLSMLAILISIFALGIIFAVGYALDSHELKFLAREELVQVLVTGVMVGLFASLVAMMGDIHTDAHSAVSETFNHISTINGELGSAAGAVGKEGSKSVYCSFSAVSFGVSACGGFRMLGAPLSQGLQLTSIALTELQALDFFMSFVENWLFALFFPLGLFLRTFKYTRGAGSLLISLGVAGYIILPLTFAAIHDVTTTFASAQGYSIRSIEVESCEEYELRNGGSANEQNAIRTFGSMKTALPALLFYTLIEATLATIISLAVMIISIRFIGMIAGAEVDVQALGRLI